MPSKTPSRTSGRSSKSSASSRPTVLSSKSFRRPRSMPQDNRRWPESFGFTIGGDAPTYILTVEPESHAYSAGLQPGDQLVELQNENVAALSGDAVKALARQCSNVPPSIVVVSCVKTCELLQDKNGKFGMGLIGGGPVFIETVEKGGPAEMVGLSGGDMVLEMNGLPIKHCDDAKLFSGSKKLKMLIIPGAGHTSVKKIAQRFEAKAQDRKLQAINFFRKLDSVFYDQPGKKDALVSLLKQYARDKQVDNFGRALSALLETPTEKQLLDNIRIFVPPKHRDRFDFLITKNAPSKGRRIVQINRASTGAFGFVLAGDKPVIVESVQPGGPASQSGLRPGDRILKLDGYEVRDLTHNELIALLRKSGDEPKMVVETGPPLPSEGQSLAAISMSSSVSVSSQSDTSSMSGWQSETSHTTTDDTRSVTTQKLSQMDMQTLGRRFKEMMEHHLTLQERKLMKKALKEYNLSRNLDALIVEIFPILDTNAKRTIWPYIVQILPEEEQEVCKKKVVYLIDRHTADSEGAHLIGSRRRRDDFETSFPRATVSAEDFQGPRFDPEATAMPSRNKLSRHSTLTEQDFYNGDDDDDEDIFPIPKRNGQRLGKSNNLPYKSLHLKF